MKRQIAGLHAADRCAADQIPDALFLVRVQRIQFRRQAQKPYYTVALAILEPSRFSGHIISSRLYCNPKALWKFNWFLHDFGYDVELLGRDEVDETQLIGLTGGIATGKSASSDFLRSQGLPVIDADLLARKVVEPGSVGYERVKESFPEAMMQDGSIDRAALGAIVFKDSHKQKLIERIIHPLVKREMLWLIFTYWICGYSRVILDIPLLFESGLYRFTSFTILIYWYYSLMSMGI